MKKKANELLRQEIPVHMAAPDQGLSRDQVEERIRGGWVNHAPVSAARSKADIILANTLTFFNCIFCDFFNIKFFCNSLANTFCHSKNYCCYDTTNSKSAKNSD